MSELRFDGRVAIVTGAGGRPSLGRAYAHLLAARGAKVVVNDLGVGPDGHGRERAHADFVAAEIVDGGGEAIADTNSVAEEESARAVVQTALDAWGRVDIVVNNAGVVVLAEFAEITANDIRGIVNVHLFGNLWMCRAAWPHMIEAGYGRIVNITSGAHLGMRHVVTYGAAKGGIIALSRGLAVEGAKHGIKVNALGPAAATAALSLLSIDEVAAAAPAAELVAPAVAFLAHEECPVSGKYFESIGGRTTARSWVESKGYTDPELTLESLRDNFDEVLDFSEPTPIADPLDGEYAELIFPKPYHAG
jgi:NAD(P)-dependent dehydrogenase (short-subunit alcohol dehydrogenase family)